MTGSCKEFSVCEAGFWYECAQGLSHPTPGGGCNLRIPRATKSYGEMPRQAGSGYGASKNSAGQATSEAISAPPTGPGADEAGQFWTSTWGSCHMAGRHHY
eukprot:scaffold641_cov490-Prasinococcus_capsulatus_cf.AAC.13